MKCGSKNRRVRIGANDSHLGTRASEQSAAASSENWEVARLACHVSVIGRAGCRHIQFAASWWWWWCWWRQLWQQRAAMMMTMIKSTVFESCVCVSGLVCVSLAWGEGKMCVGAFAVCRLRG